MVVPEEQAQAHHWWMHQKTLGDMGLGKLGFFLNLS
jgi:hypothetical protein